MSGFHKSDTALNVSKTSQLSLSDRLTMIDMTYARQDLATCAMLVDELYAFFDAAEAWT